MNKIDSHKRNVMALCSSELRPAIVFGMFETGLGVARSLGQHGIPVIGIDFKRDIAFYSRYVTPLICPHPIKESKRFVHWLTAIFSESGFKYPIFISSDPFLQSISQNWDCLDSIFIANMPSYDLLDKIGNKYEQFRLAKEAGIDTPNTFLIRSEDDVLGLGHYDLRYPLIVKGLDVNSWRQHVSGTIKGFEAKNADELVQICHSIVKKAVPCVAQEIIQGDDSKHFKYCCYIDENGTVAAEFTLQKIRQNPIHYGVGASVVSVHNEQLVAVGRRLFNGIGYRGIGSAEFKHDENDSSFKLIEINPRYWQQNYLTTACGINFAYANYSDLMSHKQQILNTFKAGVIWVNIYMDAVSYMGYSKEGTLSFYQWICSLKGKKVLSDFTWDDPLPILYEIRFGLKLLKLPIVLLRKIRGKHYNQ